MFPNLDIRKEVLFVHDGKYITSSGGAKSFEAAFIYANISTEKTLLNLLQEVWLLIGI